MKVLILLLVSIVLVGCLTAQDAPVVNSSTVTAQIVNNSSLGSSENIRSATRSAPPENNGSDSQLVGEPSTLREFNVTARNWEFVPGTITVAQGERVKLNIKSVDVDHGFALPDFDVNAQLSPDVETTVEFIADKPGSFTFFCSVFCGNGHSEMTGTLIVTP